MTTITSPLQTEQHVPSMGPQPRAKDRADIQPRPPEEPSPHSQPEGKVVFFYLALAPQGMCLPGVSNLPFPEGYQKDWWCPTSWTLYSPSQSGAHCQVRAPPHPPSPTLSGGPTLSLGEGLPCLLPSLPSSEGPCLHGMTLHLQDQEGCSLLTCPWRACLQPTRLHVFWGT